MTDTRFQVEIETSKDTTYFQIALARWREHNPQFNDIPFSQFPWKYASDVIAAAQILKAVADDCSVAQAQLELVNGERR